MWTDLLLGLSGVLIGAGMLLLLRDRGAKRGLMPAWMRLGRSVGSQPPPTLDQPDAAEPCLPGAALSGSFATHTESAEAWARSERMLDLAIRATNAAFAAAGAQIVDGDGPNWSETDGGHRAAYLIEREGREIATLVVLHNRAGFAFHILRDDDVQLPAAIRVVAADAATVPRLAEAIAACTWPCVAQAGR